MALDFYIQPVVKGIGQLPGLVFGPAGTGDLLGTLFLQGRVHYYEGHSHAALTFGVRLLAELGIRRLIVTNAAGGIRADFAPGDLMLLTGHLSFLRVHRPADVPHTRADHLWNTKLRQLARQSTTSLHVHEGVYAMMSGPCYETPAEVRMLRSLGADAVGMSTVPEAIEAARRKIDVLGVSCITNIASGLSAGTLNHFLDLGADDDDFFGL